MQSENFDNKIKDSLSQRPPGNENPEWDRMQTLLDQHLPVEKKDRRRMIVILFLFLLLGGGAFFIWQNNRPSDNDIADGKPNTANTTPNNSPDATGKPAQNGTSGNETTLKEIPKNNPDENSGGHSTGVATTQQEPNPIQKGDKIIIPWSKNSANPRDTRNNKPEKQVRGETPVKTQPITSVDKNNNQQDPLPGVQKTDQPGDKPGKLTEPAKTDEPQRPGKLAEEQKQKSAESQPTLAANSKKEKQPKKNSFFDNLLFSLSAGPDFSAVGMDDVGRLKPVIGAGIGYQVSEKFTIRTGFYSARKVYTADPYDYHPPYNLYTAYPNLKNIDANCKVYEIPVTVDYTISQNKQQSWFVSAGLSSYLMKKEVYDYHFKPNSSPTYITYTRTIRDQNKHYFSVLDVSGGYTRTINKNFSLRAEPYAKFALSGVGYGKVKLNSGGVLLSAIIKPFARK